MSNRLPLSRHPHEIRIPHQMLSKALVKMAKNSDLRMAGKISAIKELRNELRNFLGFSPGLKEMKETVEWLKENGYIVEKLPDRIFQDGITYAPMNGFWQVTPPNMRVGYITVNRVSNPIAYAWLNSKEDVCNCGPRIGMGGIPTEDYEFALTLETFDDLTTEMPDYDGLHELHDPDLEPPTDRSKDELLDLNRNVYFKERG